VFLRLPDFKAAKIVNLSQNCNVDFAIKYYILDFEVFKLNKYQKTK